MRRIFFVSVWLLSLLSPCVAQVRTEQLKEFLQSLETRELALGSLAIYQNNKQIFTGTLGFSSISENQKTPTALNTRYRIGSVSKVFTAVMIFQLIEKNKLSLNQFLSDFYPDLPNAGKITLAHLLNHQSGLHDYTNATGFEEWMDKPKSHAELIEIIRAKGMDFEPGSKNEYCNTNYLLLSYILEKVTGLSYEKNLESRITSKLKLKDTYIASPSEAKPGESISYKYSNGSWSAVKQTYPGIHLGAGSIISTVSDLSVFIQSLFTGKLVSKSSLTEMETMVNEYGYGLFPYDYGTSKGYGHNGRIEEFYTATRYYPETKISVVYCTNGINFPRTDILESIIKSCFNENIEIPFTSGSAADLTSYAGTYEATGMPPVVLSVQNSKPVAETQGARFELEPVMINYFVHPVTGYYFQFIPNEHALLIKETDNVYYLKKK